MDYEISKKDIRAITTKLNKFSKEITSNDVLLQVALSVKNKILLQTGMGKDAHGKRFKPYSPQYAKAKGKRNAWLYDTGLMLNSMTQKVLGNNAVMIFFNNQTARERAEVNNPSRTFFEFTGLNTEDTIKQYNKYVQGIKSKNQL